MKNKKIGLLIQAILCICTVVFFIISMFESSFLIVAEFLISLTLFAMAFNNINIYKRKNFTLIYTIFASIVLIFSILEIINGK